MRYRKRGRQRKNGSSHGIDDHVATVRGRVQEGDMPPPA